MESLLRQPLFPWVIYKQGSIFHTPLEYAKYSDVVLNMHEDSTHPEKPATPGDFNMKSTFLAMAWSC